MDGNQNASSVFIGVHLWQMILDSSWSVAISGHFRIIRGMDDSIRKSLVPGAQVVVTQQIAHRIPSRAWTNKTAGTVVEYMQKPTGSWYAHSKNDKLWLDRLKIKKTDGELTTLILDEYTHVEIKG